MTILRDRSKIKKPKSVVNSKPRNDRNWTAKDKQVLTELLREGVHTNEEIQSYLPRFTLDEVKEFMGRKMELAREMEQVDEIIEEQGEHGNNWSDIFDKLLENVPDYSFQFENIIRNFQEGFDKSCTSNKKVVGPNWHLVYEYISMLFNGSKLPKLGQVEAGVVLMLLEDLFEQYECMETSEQRSICRAKNQILSKILAVDESVSSAEKHEIINSALNLSNVGIPQQQSADNPTQTNDNTSQMVVVPGNEIKQHEPLYSINPLCIPIQLLNPLSKP